MRRRGRECALQLLYQLDLGTSLESRSGVTDALNNEVTAFWENFESVESQEREFADRLVHGVLAAVKDLDVAITEASKNWKLPRMANVDRNLLRLAAYEILYCPDIPRSVSINEAIEIAKRFSGTEASSFINGVLDQLKEAA
jgi:N utilization substance protein B